MKQFSLFIILLLLSFAGYSQIHAADYSYAASSGAFTSIAGTGTPVTFFGTDDETVTDIPIGFTFNYCSVNYSTVSACTNAWLSLSNSGDNRWYNGDPGDIGDMADINGGIGLLMAYWDDMNLDPTGSGPVSTAYYQTIGTPGSQTFIFEWSGLYRGGGGSGETQDIQIVLHEGTNQIEFKYTNGALASTNATIGIANSTTDYQTLTNNSPTALSTTTFTNDISGSPADGQVYAWNPPPFCTGLPIAGTAHASLPTACNADNIVLSLGGGTVASGLAYQWQVSSDSLTWVNSGVGDTNSTFTTTQSAVTYYRALVSCASTGDMDSSSGVRVNFLPVCFCTPAYVESPASYMYEGIDNFTVTGYSGSTINNNGLTPTPPDGYENIAGVTVDMQQGNVYNGTISYRDGWSNYGTQIWIDFDDNASFDVSEEVTPVVSSGSYSDPFAITIPISANPGLHRMRVRYYVNYDGGPVATHVDPCNNSDADGNTYYYGTTRDYSANIIPAPGCSGAPTAGVATASTTLACPATAFTLSATGITIATGLTYQWESSLLGVTYTNISGATSPTYSAVESVPTYYRLKVTCPASSLSDTSTAVFVNYFGFCYCVPVYNESPASSMWEGMDQFDLTGYSASSISEGGFTPIPANGYEDHTATSIDLQQGGAYNGNISYRDIWHNYETQIWIDFGDDGTFDPSDEITSPIYTAPNSSSDPFTINIPISAPVGLHRMRIRYAVLDYNQPLSTHMDPCLAADADGNNYNYGTTRDYMANIIAAPACSGTPSAGTVVSSVNSVCAASSFSLSATGITAATSLTYHWQSSPTIGGTYNDISGATATSYSGTQSAPTYYQLMVTCGVSGLSATSAPVLVNFDTICYCIPVVQGFPASSTSDGIDVFSVNGYSSTSIADAGPATIPLNGYEDRTAIAVDFQQSGVYSGNISYLNTWYRYETQVWIDFGDDGVFDPSDEVTTPIFSASYASSDVFTLTIPYTATPGAHRMRVRYIIDDVTGGTSTHMDPCADHDPSADYSYGTTRDYTANIIALPPCTGAPVLGTASITPTAGGVSDPFTLSLPGLSPAAGVNYQWQSASASSGPWTDIAGATNTTYSFLSIFADTYYRMTATCTLSGGTTSTSGSVVAYFVYAPPCAPTASSWFYPSDISYTGIDEFSVTGYAGSTLSDVGITAAASSTTAYLDQTATLPAVSMEQGGVYASSATWIDPSYTHQALQVWIDFNDNGIFEAVEEVSPVSGFSTSGTPAPTNFNITVPAGATIGLHKMRLRGIYEYDWTSSAPAHLDPCQRRYQSTTPRYASGDAIDYMVNIVVHCPFAVTATTGGAICPYAPVSLSATVDATVTSYSWSGPGGYTSTNLTATAPGIGTSGVYSFTATDGTCTSTLVTTQTLLAAAVPPVVTPAVTTMCNGGSQTLTATVPGTPVTAFSEDFNAGLSAWTVDNTGSTATASESPWQIFSDGYDYSGITYHSPDNSDFVMTNGDAGGSGTVTISSLISPTFSLAGLAVADLSFQTSYQQYWNDHFVTVDISTDGGTTWNTLYDYFAAGVTVGSPNHFHTDNYSLTAYAGATNCKLRFYYNTTFGNRWALDNVVVTGTPAIGDAPTWTPVTDLYSDPAMTVPYVAGTPAYEVYVRPATATASDTTDYIASIGYALTSCISTDTGRIIVNVPAITAPASTNLCIGNDLALTGVAAGGTWSSSATGVASVDATSGLVHGVGTGTANIIYTVGGCSTSLTVNVSGVVTLNTGTTRICSGGLTSVLSNTTGGGTWSSGNTAVASVSSTGTVTTSGIGQAIITYTLPSGCADTSLITSVAPPAAITGSTSVCYAGGTTSLSDVTAGGTWSLTPGTTVATINASGVVTGLTAGTAVVTYTTLTGCTATATLTLNAYPSPITGATAVCAGSTISLGNPSTGTWSSSNTARATVDASGVVSGVSSGSAVITFTSANGCAITSPLTVNAQPAVIGGTTTICNLASVTLTDATPGGTWSTTTPLVISINSSTGMITALASGAGNVVYTVTTTGCQRAAAITVNALPAAITAPATVCNLSTATVTSTSTGTWSSSPLTTATVGSTTGVVHGVSVGTANITLTDANNCRTTTTISVVPSYVPTVTIAATPGTTVCAGTAVSYATTVTNGGTAPTYSWTVNGVGVSTGTAYNYTPNNNDVVKVDIVSNLTCAVPNTASNTVTMTVNPIVVPSLSLSTASGDTGCLGSPTTIYTHPVDAGASPLFQWYVNGSPVTGSSSYTYTANDNDLVSVTMTSTSACLSGSTSSTTSSTLTLDIIPYVVPDVLLTSSTGGPVGCSGNIVVFTATPTNGGGAPSYLWTVNGVNVATGPTYFYSPVNNDDVKVVMTSSYPCVLPPIDADTMHMAVGVTATPVVSITAYPGTTVAIGANATFVAHLASGGGAAPVYQWFVNGVGVAGANNDTFITNTLNTGDLVTVHVTNADLCGATTISNVLVMHIGASGISQVTGGEATIALVPNPNNGTFVVKGTLGAAITEGMVIEVTDMVGQVVYTGSTQASNGDFNEQIKLDGILANGMYILNIRSQHMNKTFHFVLEQK